MISQLENLRRRWWTGREWPVAATLLVFLIIGLGWIDRRQLPPLPVLDADSMGYLQPAISFFSGEGLQQAHGRSVFYPSMLIAFLGSGLSFDSMVRGQQSLGALAALALWGCWLVFWSLLPRSRLRDPVAALVGVVFMGFYYFNPSVVFYEHCLRPEAVIPFFGATQLLATGLYLLARGGRLDARWLVPAGALAIFLAYCCLALKPSWIMASGAAVLLVMTGWIRAGSRTRPAVAGLLIGLLAAAGLFVAYRAWKKPDLRESSLAPDTFLAKTLITTHADIILPILGQEVREQRKSVLPFKPLREFTANFRRELLAARKDIEKYPQWEIHGVRYPFNPDYLMFTTDIARPLKEAGMDRKQIAGFYLQCYFLAVLRDPADIARKILHNLGFFFLPDFLTFYNRPWFEKGLEGSSEHLALGATYQDPALPYRAKFLAAAARVDAFRKDDRPAARQAGGAGGAIAIAAQSMCLAAPMISLIFLALGIQILAVPSLRAALGPALLFVAILYSVPLANALNVSIVQSLGVIARYRQTYGMFYAFSMAAMLAFVITAYERIISQQRARQP